MLIQMFSNHVVPHQHTLHLKEQKLSTRGLTLNDAQRTKPMYAWVPMNEAIKSCRYHNLLSAQFFWHFLLTEMQCLGYPRIIPVFRDAPGVCIWKDLSRQVLYSKVSSKRCSFQARIQPAWLLWVSRSTGQVWANERTCWLFTHTASRLIDEDHVED